MKIPSRLRNKLWQREVSNSSELRDKITSELGQTEETTCTERATSHLIGANNTQGIDQLSSVFFMTAKLMSSLSAFLISQPNLVNYPPVADHC